MKNTSSPLLGILEDATTPGEMAQALRAAFPAHQKTSLTSKDLKDPAQVNALDLLFLPGIAREDSPYPRLIGPKQKSVIESAMHDGLVVLAECAGMWHVLETFNYVSARKAVEGFRGLGWLKGQGDGPVGVIAGAATRAVRVEFNGPAGCGVPYSNGPAYLPAQGEKIDVIARFADVPGRPVAVGGKEMGKGYLAFQSVLPAIRAGQVAPFIKGRKGQFPAVARLIDDMAAHEDGRERLLQTVLSNLRPRLRSARP